MNLETLSPRCAKKCIFETAYDIILALRNTKVHVIITIVILYRIKTSTSICNFMLCVVVNVHQSRSSDYREYDLVKDCDKIVVCRNKVQRTVTNS